MIQLKDNIPTGTFPIVTVLLIVLNIGGFFWQQTTPSDPVPQHFGLSDRDVQTFEYGAIPYRLTHPGKNCGIGATPGANTADVYCEGMPDYQDAETSGSTPPFLSLKAVPWFLTILFAMFMHAGFLHIGGNMLFLWVFGNNVEDALGPLKFLLFYLVAGVVAIYAQSALGPDSTVPTIGASGAVAGVLGAYLLLHPKAKVLTLIFVIFLVTVIEIPATILLGVWFVLQFIPAVSGLDDLGNGGVAYLAHVGGFVFGLLAIKLIMMRRGSDQAPPSYPASLPPPGYG
ncbi:rhomboid family intramembrane serine protease [soil metagenome]